MSSKTFFTTDRIKAYFYITKPGIILGNLIATLGGFLLGARGNINLVTLFGALVGMGICIACACVLNNYIDRDIDSKMKRTSKRTDPKSNLFDPARYPTTKGIALVFSITT